MCKLGDIIVVRNYIGKDGVKINTHSFVVINDKPDFIEGLSYDLIANVMSSFKNEEHRTKKLRFQENVEIVSNNIISYKKINLKNGYIKADKLIYFNKKKTDYYILGRISDDFVNELMMIILLLDKKGKLKTT